MRQFTGGGQQSTHLAVLAWIRHRAGQDERATELIDGTVLRFDLDLLLTCHVKALIEGWQAEELLERVVEWHDHVVRPGMDPRARMGAMVDLIDQEIEAWT